MLVPFPALTKEDGFSFRDSFTHVRTHTNPMLHPRISLYCPKDHPDVSAFMRGAQFMIVFYSLRFLWDVSPPTSHPLVR